MGRLPFACSQPPLSAASAAEGAANHVPRTLYDPLYEHESCGVGFVATLTNTPSHSILTKALVALSRLAHRGAIAADGTSSDGIGICTALPRAFLLEEAGIRLEAAAPFAVGAFFYPPGIPEDDTALRQALEAQRFEILGWRQVPTRPEILGTIAHSTMPVIRHLLLTSPDGAKVDLDGGVQTLNMKALGGRLPLAWFINGAPVAQGDFRRQSAWKPDGAGFARVTVIDAQGAADSALIRIN